MLERLERREKRSAREEGTHPKKGKKKTKTPTPPRRKAGKQKNPSGTRKNWAPRKIRSCRVLGEGKGLRTGTTDARARSARGGARSAPRRHLAIFGGAKKSSIFQGVAENFGDETKMAPPKSTHPQCRDGTRVPSMVHSLHRQQYANMER